MSDVALLNGDFPLTVDYLKPILLELPQAHAPVYHRFGPGIYIRELHAAKDTLIVGHIQKQDHSNLLLQGSVLMINEDESTQLIEAPAFIVGKAGSRKVALVVEYMVLQNIYATEETNIDNLEAMFLEPDDAKNVKLKQMHEDEVTNMQAVRNDYVQFLNQYNITEEEIQQYVQIDDVVDFPTPNTLRVADSAIEGKGLFTTAPINTGDFIALARVNGSRTPAGRYANHSPTPNCTMMLVPNGDMALVATQNIDGCVGGLVGTELTVDYRQVMSINPVLTKQKE